MRYHCAKVRFEQFRDLFGSRETEFPVGRVAPSKVPGRIELPFQDSESYVLTIILWNRKCAYRESNPSLSLGRALYYHYTICTLCDLGGARTHDFGLASNHKTRTLTN